MGLIKYFISFNFQGFGPQSIATVATCTSIIFKIFYIYNICVFYIYDIYIHI